MLDQLISACRQSIQPRMLALPMYNPKLEIEAVGFAKRAGRESGVLITPWCMNLLLFPGAGDGWENHAAGKTIVIDFPAGQYDCMISMNEGIAPHVSLPLFTTVQDFPDQDTARRVALEVLYRLYTSAAAEMPSDAADNLSNDRRAKRTLTRRELLQGFAVRP